jgi:quercetin dioxygenase-like cupin family protein
MTMAKQFAVPGQVVDLNRSATTTDTNQKTVLIRSNVVEVIRLLIPAGSTIPTYQAAGHIILHCLEGRISIFALDKTQELSAGQLLYLALNEAFSIHGIVRASVLATTIAPKHGADVELIGRQ